MKNLDTLLLSKSDIEKTLTMKDTLQIVEDVFIAHGNKQIIMPSKITLDLGEKGGWPNYNAYINALPAYFHPTEIAGVKWVGGFWDNYKKGLPSIVGMIILNEPSTGIPIAVMDGTLITAYRTGAVAAIGAKYLAQENEVLSIIGCGSVGKFTLRAMKELFDINKIKIFDIRNINANKFKKDMEDELDINIEISENIKETVNDSDIIITATSGQEPFLKGDWIKKGTYICSLGSYEELFDDVIWKADKIIVDNKKQTIHRGVLFEKIDKNVITENDIYAELGDIITGIIKGRENSEEIELFVPIGMGTEDVAIAYEVYKKAYKEKMGKNFTFF